MSKAKLSGRRAGAEVQSTKPKDSLNYCEAIQFEGFVDTVHQVYGFRFDGKDDTAQTVIKLPSMGRPTATVLKKQYVSYKEAIHKFENHIEEAKIKICRGELATTFISCMTGVLSPIMC